jgi:diguanylate cyclase (GGDEF)-like protein
MSLILGPEARILVGTALQDTVSIALILRQNLSSLARVQPPPELTDFLTAAERLRDQMSPEDQHTRVEFSFDDRDLRILRAALALRRRVTAEQIEASQQHLTSAWLSRALDESLRPLNDLLNNPALSGVVPMPAPTMADFVTAEGRRGQNTIDSLAQEERDPKHRVLLSSSLILHDLMVYRKQCEERRLPFAVVFADLDDFKKFNAELGEVTVDRQILPPILAAVEAASYGHGRAYRHGGDEFVLLLPNVDVAVITSLVQQLKHAVESLTFDVTGLVPRLSAGVWITLPGSHLTANELVDRASQAKAASKSGGKSRITIRREVGSGYSEEIAK